MKRILVGLVVVSGFALAASVGLAAATGGTSNPRAPSNAPGPGQIGNDPCPSLPCSLVDTYKVTYRLSDGSLVSMVSYKFDASDPSAGPVVNSGEAVLDISTNAALITALSKDLDAYRVNVSTRQIQKRAGYVAPVPGPSAST